MLGKKQPFKNIPFFWTRNYEKSLCYIGHSENPDEVHYAGEVAKNNFAAYFIKGDKLEAVAY